jgi:hypothetical protein
MTRIGDLLMTQDPQQPDPHDRKCALRIRTRRLVEAGDPPEPPAQLLREITREIRECCAHSWLKAHRLAHDWTVEEAVAAFHEMCAARKLGTRGLTVRSWTEWEAGANPNADYQDLLCRLFATGPVQLGFATDYSDQDSVPQVEEPEAPALPLGAESVTDAEEGNGTNRRDAFKHVGAAAEALAFTRRAQASAVGPGALEHLELAVTEINMAWTRTPPDELFDTARWYRQQVDRLIAGQHTLREGRQLYAYAGWLSQLLALLAFDLGTGTPPRRTVWTPGTTAWKPVTTSCAPGRRTRNRASPCTTISQTKHWPQRSKERSTCRPTTPWP